MSQFDTEKQDSFRGFGGSPISCRGTRQAQFGFARGEFLNQLSGPPFLINTEDQSVAPAQPQDAWRGFKPGLWQRDINVRWFLQSNYTPYEGDDKFLSLATDRTRDIWSK